MSDNQNRIRVLHIITNLPIGGAQDNTLLTVEKLDHKKYHVSLMCSPEGIWLQRAQQIKDLNLIFVDELARDIHIVKDFIAFWKIFKLLKKGRYTIIHTHTTKASFLGRIAAKLIGIPIIIHTIHGIHFHEYINPFIRKLYILIERFLSKLTDRIITVSKLNLEKAVKLRFAERNRFVNIYSGIEFERFDVQIDVEAKKRELGILSGEKVVGMVGRFSAQKAPLDFVKAIPEVLKERNDVKFVLIGDGELKQRIFELARKLGLDSELIFLGFRDDVPELLKVLDVYVLTSLWEGLGRSLTEAMYTGRPVVATNVEGVPELVIDGQTGILVTPKDVKSIAQGILTLLSDEKKAKQLGQAAKRQISKEFHVQQMVAELEKVYSQVITNKKNV